MFDDFRDAIRATGLIPPDSIEPGRFVRFPGIGKRPGNRAGWCILMEDGRGGAFGDFAADFRETWHRGRDRSRHSNWRPRGGSSPTMHLEAAIRARDLWEKATPVRAHPYLVSKRIKAFGAKALRDLLVLPIIGFDGILHTLQFIDAVGNKRYLKGGRKAGCLVHAAGPALSHSRVIICEGWATGCSLAEHEQEALVLAALDAGNLEAVAVQARRRWPESRIVLASDDDRRTPGNPGRTKAHAAAAAVGGLVALPDWPEGAPDTLSDFNDLAVWKARCGS